MGSSQMINNGVNYYCYHPMRISVAMILYMRISVNYCYDPMRIISMIIYYDLWNMM